MYSIDKDYSAEYEINKSKFISFAYPVFDTDSVDEILKVLQAEYNDATHICYAYTIDSPQVEKAQDDGEPGGTAGKPLLELLKKKKINNTLIVVVRYFGGIKLGAGGLVRAYTNAGNMALDLAKVVEFVSVNKYSIIAPLKEGQRLKSNIIGLGGEILSERYEDRYIIEIVGEIEGIQEKFRDVQIVHLGSELKCR